ncbi:MAG: hypothetical protein J3K34DRAFT_518755 [Monoraphidium minutum]|nr:MAG: hypothetical protein J3K34DRAFT_518755 [Monoraphidium minutum]
MAPRGRRGLPALLALLALAHVALAAASAPAAPGGGWDLARLLQSGSASVGGVLGSIGGIPARLRRLQQAAAPIGGFAANATQGVKFLEVHPDLGEHPAVQDFQPSIHGAVEKKGNLAWSHWWNRNGEDRVDSFLSYRINRTVYGPGPAAADSYTCAKADHPKLPFPGCHVFLNTKYKMIYVRSPKSASSSIMDELGECTNRHTRGFNSSYCLAMHNSWEHYFYRHGQMKNVTEMWKDYFVFGFVRNPWKRAYSLFKYMQSDGCMPNEKLKDPYCLSTKWANFCKDPWGTTDVMHHAGCIKRSKSYMYFHMMDQYHCLVTDTGDWAVDYIGRVEHLNDDWAEVMTEVNKRRDPSVEPVPINALIPKNIRASRSSKDPYSGDNAHCLDAVSRWHACDIEKFNFLGGEKLVHPPHPGEHDAAAAPAAPAAGAAAAAGESAAAVESVASPAPAEGAAAAAAAAPAAAAPAEDSGEHRRHSRQHHRSNN